MDSVSAERQMVFYNRIFMAFGKETERQTDHGILQMFHKYVLYCAEIVFCKLQVNLLLTCHELCMCVLCLQVSHP